MKQTPVLPMNVEIHSNQQVVYDKDLADSFLFPESNRSDYRFLYIASQYRPTQNRVKDEATVSTTKPSENALKRNVASVARLLKKAQDKGLCLEDLLDDETADTIISFLTEATSASVSDGTPPSVTQDLTNTDADLLHPPTDIFTTGKSRHKSTLETSKTKTKQKQQRKLESKTGTSPDDSSKKLTKQKRHSKAAMPNKKPTKQQARQRQSLTASKPPISLPTHTDTVTAPKTSSKATGVGRVTDIVSNPSFLDMLDAPNASIVSPMEPAQTISAERIDSATATTKAPPRSNRKPFHQPLKNFLHATVKEKRPYNLKAHLKRDGGPDTTNLLVDASFHPICVDPLSSETSSK